MDTNDQSAELARLRGDVDYHRTRAESWQRTAEEAAAERGRMTEAARVAEQDAQAWQEKATEARAERDALARDLAAAHDLLAREREAAAARIDGLRAERDAMGRRVAEANERALRAAPPPASAPKGQCIGYPNCDGDLEGMEHSAPCPLASTGDDPDCPPPTPPAPVTPHACSPRTDCAPECMDGPGMFVGKAEGEQVKPNCWACAHSYKEPDSDLTCGHPDAGAFGIYVRRGPADHCGPDRSKFKQHPLRNPDGTLKG